MPLERPYDPELGNHPVSANIAKAAGLAKLATLHTRRNKIDVETQEIVRRLSTLEPNGGALYSRIGVRRT
jgi:hypothetical protein